MCKPKSHPKAQTPDPTQNRLTPQSETEPRLPDQVGCLREKGLKQVCDPRFPNTPHYSLKLLKIPQGSLGTYPTTASVRKSFKSGALSQVCQALPGQLSSATQICSQLACWGRRHKKTRLSAGSVHSLSRNKICSQLCTTCTHARHEICTSSSQYQIHSVGRHRTVPRTPLRTL